MRKYCSRSDGYGHVFVYHSFAMVNAAGVYSERSVAVKHQYSNDQLELAYTPYTHLLILNAFGSSFIPCSRIYMTNAKHRTDLLTLLMVNIGVFALLVGLLELAILCFFWFPGLSAMLPDSLRYYPIKIYTDIGRTVTREFAAWDPELTYTLQPTVTVRHKNREFDVKIRTNSMGLRDDEQSLSAPEIIAIGDSFTMGFGVEQDSTFPQMIEKQTGMTVLNAGIESYGTAREVLLLKRLDTSNLQTLIVQYCPNDLTENAAFLANNGRLDTMDEQRFTTSYEQYRTETEYYFGKYLWYLATHLIPAKAPVTSEAEKKQRSYQHARGFLDSLQRLPIATKDVQLIVMVIIDLNASYLLRYDPDFDNQRFLKDLSSLIESDRYPDFIRNMRLIDVMGALDGNDWFVLDGHLTAQGHQKIADHVLRTLH